MYNKLIMIGNLIKDIELRYLQNSTAVAKGSIATSHKYKSKDGAQKEEVCFIDFDIFGRSAEIANQYLKKGSKVMLDGRLVFSQWEDSQTNTTKSKHTLLVNELKMLDSKSKETKENKPQINIEKLPSINLDEIDFDIFEDDKCPF
jgi:single-strand DNA-binding protein